MIDLRLSRKKYTREQTIGFMEVYRNNLFECVLSTLEQDWANNIRSDSCIPPGHYIIENHSSPNHGDCLLLKGTEPRTYILIHSGNYYNHTEGCILVGLSHSDINKDGYLDVIHSGDALKKLLSLCEGEKIISITIE